MTATADLYRSYLDLRWHFDPAQSTAAGRTDPTYRFLLFGDQAIISPLLDKYPKLKAKAEIRHASALGTAFALPSIRRAPAS